MTTIADALRRTGDVLESAGADSPRIQARSLLAKATTKNAVWVYQNLQESLPADDVAQLAMLVERRVAGEPLPYLLGEVEFYGRRFVIDNRVLVPRPETEEMLELALNYARARRNAGHPVRRALDVGTGSGVLAVSLAAELPDALVIGVDRSPEALAVALRNRVLNGVEERVLLVLGDLLDGIAMEADLVVANLPYVSSCDIDRLQPEVRREPRMALDGGPDGLDLYRRFFVQVGQVLVSPGLVLAEIGASHGDLALDLVRKALPHDPARVVADSFGRDRFIVIERQASARNPFTT